MRNAWGSSDDNPTTSLKMVARVKIPALPAVKGSTKFAKQIRDNILRDEFGYTDADIDEFNSKHPDDLVIEDTTNPNRWAEDAQVKSWRTGTDGLVPITLEERWAESVWNFRSARASFEVFKVGMFITDAEIKKDITDDLENILNSSGEKRINALNNLMNTMSGSPATRLQLYRALRFLTNESGYKNNPFLMLAFAATTAYKSDTPAMGSSQINQNQIADAVKAMNEKLYNNPSKSALTGVSRMEAAQINAWASRLYDGVNANNEATNRRWMERFLGMSDAERKSYKEGDLVGIASGQTAMRGDFPSEKKLNDANQNFADQNRQWAEIDGIGKDQSFDLKGDHRQSEYYQRPTDLYPTGSKVVPANDPAHNVIRVPDKFKSVYDNVSTDGTAAPIALYLEYAKWNTANERMKVITNYLNRKSQLEARVRTDNYRVVPPPPMVVEKYIKDFQRDGRIIVNPLQKTKIYGILSELQGLLEESYAFYKAK